MIALLLKSRAACSLFSLVAVIGGLFVWHQVDKTSAVRRALANYVAHSELQALRVHLNEANRRHAVAQTARKQLEAEIEQATAQAEAAAEELEHYVSTVEDNCVVDPGLRERLRNR